jgi:hypothetical protein
LLTYQGDALEKTPVLRARHGAQKQECIELPRLNREYNFRSGCGLGKASSSRHPLRYATPPNDYSDQIHPLRSTARFLIICSCLCERPTHERVMRVLYIDFLCTCCISGFCLSTMDPGGQQFRGNAFATTPAHALSRESRFRVENYD